MGPHDNYGKRLFKDIFGEYFTSIGDSVKVKYADAVTSTIDGVIDISDNKNGKTNKLVAIEIESRTDKQVQGAIIDLLNHRSKYKLLIIIPAHNSKNIERRCNIIIDRYKNESDKVKLILLSGTGHDRKGKEDKTKIIDALREWNLFIPKH